MLCLKQPSPHRALKNILGTLCAVSGKRHGANFAINFTNRCAPSYDSKYRNMATRRSIFIIGQYRSQASRHVRISQQSYRSLMKYVSGQAAAIQTSSPIDRRSPGRRKHGRKRAQDPKVIRECSDWQLPALSVPHSECLSASRDRAQVDELRAAELVRSRLVAESRIAQYSKARPPGPPSRPLITA